MTPPDDTSTLTPKGRATRARILQAAAELFYERGVGGTTNDDLRAAAGVSGSQLNHYFPSRAALVDAVLRARVADAVDPARFPDSGLPHSLASLRAWADTYVDRFEHLHGGCYVGSLAGELLKTSPAARAAVGDGFERWRSALRDGLQAMREAGELRADADPDHLSTVVLAGLQGGLLLTQASGSTAALRAALDGVLTVVERYSAP